MSDPKETSDGGRVALSGFLYQMLGVFGLRACGRAESEADGISSLLALVSDETAVVHEAYDADVGLLAPIAEAGGQGVVLVQFKYSSAGADATIPPATYKDILTRFHAATVAAKQDGKTVTGRFLVTNRVYGRETKKIAEAVRTLGTHSELKPEQDLMAKDLHLISKIEPEMWVKRLYEFGYSYGLTDHEIRGGLNALIGQLLGGTVDYGPYECSKELLVKSLTGVEQARPLHHQNVLPEMRSALSELGADSSRKIIKRANVEQLFSQHMNRALVVCLGPGGTGKTSSLREWASLTVSTRFVDSRRASRVTSDWIFRLVDKWRHMSSGCASPESSLQRLAQANPDISSPLLHLNIDGIDERAQVGANTDAICSLLEWFWSEDREVRNGTKVAPSARLIVTCRRIDDFTPFWRQNTSGFPDAEPELPPTIPFDVFTDAEFSELVQCERAELDDHICARLMHATSTSLGSAEDQIFDSTVSGFQHSMAPRNTIEDNLHHPAIWGAFLALPKEQRGPFLDGESVASNALAERYTERFFKKAVARLENLKIEDVRLAYRKIAAVSIALPPASLNKSLWNEVIAKGELGFGIPHALDLFFEAVSAGVIEVESARWRWRYQYVANYLASFDKEGVE